MLWRVSTNDPSDLGPNLWMADEMRARWEVDPSSVAPQWRAIFETEPANGAVTPEPASSAAIEVESIEVTRPAATIPEPTQQAHTEPKVAKIKASPAPLPGETPAAGAAPTATRPAGEPIRGAAARIVTNMEASLDVPTATSFRQVPAKLLEVNRKVINGFLARKLRGKISFTHLIGYAVVRAIADSMPAMNNTYATTPDGKPMLLRNEHIGLGIAVDLEKADGSRTLMVPCITMADTLEFNEFVDAYEALIEKLVTAGSASTISPAQQ